MSVLKWRQGRFFSYHNNTSLFLSMQLQFQLQPAEVSFYSTLQQDILKDKATLSYRKLIDKYGFSSAQQLENFLFRSILGFKMEKIDGDGGPIPLVPEIVTKSFVEECMQQAIELNCIYTHKAERAYRAYEIALSLKCPALASYVIDRLTETYLSSQWFTNYCKTNGLHIVNAQTLQYVRRKFCHTKVMEKFYSMLQALVHDNPYLIYNVYETSVTSNRKGKLVVPEGKNPFVSEEQMFGHMTAVLFCNAAGEALDPFLILPTIMNLPSELVELQSQCIFATSPSGWMTSHIFLIWTLFFVSEVNQKRNKLYHIQGEKSIQATLHSILGWI